MSILKKAAKILPDDILRHIVSYVPRLVSIHKTGWIEMIRRLNEDEVFRSKRYGSCGSYGSFRRGQNKLKTAAAMTYEDPWYGACHMMILTRQNKNNAAEFHMTQWADVFTNGFFGKRFFREWIFFRFNNGHQKAIHVDP